VHPPWAVLPTELIVRGSACRLLGTGSPGAVKSGPPGADGSTSRAG